MAMKKISENEHSSMLHRLRQHGTKEAEELEKALQHYHKEYHQLLKKLEHTIFAYNATVASMRSGKYKKESSYQSIIA
jgi:hypothetical protein